MVSNEEIKRRAVECVRSPEGQRSIQESLEAARQVVEQLNKATNKPMTWSDWNTPFNL